MNQKLTVPLALASGLLGAMLSRSLIPLPAFAQTPSPGEIRAHKFTLVDYQDQAVGAFTVEPTGPMSSPLTALFQRNNIPSRIVLRDSDGRELWSATLSK
jgi:hypothetical protein